MGLLATGGSTNHAIHLLAIARAAGIIIDWEDLDDLSEVTPLLARIYPNGAGDVNQFEAAGGMAFTIASCWSAGLLHRDVLTVAGDGLAAYAARRAWTAMTFAWREAPAHSRRRDHAAPGRRRRSRPDGGMRLLTRQPRPRDHQDQRGG